MRKDRVYFDGSNTTNKILDVLEEKRPKIIAIDELDKMSKQFQNQLLNFMESGRVKVDQQRKSYDFEIKGAKIFASSNNINRISKPLQSRFRRLFLSRYSEEQFLNVSEKALPKLSSGLARYIGVQIWKQNGDIRDVISAGKLVRCWKEGDRYYVEVWYGGATETKKKQQPLARLTCGLCGKTQVGLPYAYGNFIGTL